MWSDGLVAEFEREATMHSKYTIYYITDVCSADASATVSMDELSGNQPFYRQKSTLFSG